MKSYFENKFVVTDKDEIFKIIKTTSGKKELKNIFIDQKMHYSKAEMLTDCVVGELVYDEDINAKKDKNFLVYYLNKETLYIVKNEKNGNFIKEFIKSISTDSLEIDAITLFFSLMEFSVKDEMSHLQKIDTIYDKLEEILMNEEKGSDYNPVKQAAFYRKILVAKNFRYQQLANLSGTLAENPYDFFSEHDEFMFQSFGNKIDRFSQYSQMLREYFVQLREMYHQNLEIKENKTMRILTIVTTIFFPLTLIAGWYGMNFVNMPELQSQYGYVIIIGISVVIIIVEIIIFKRKNFW